MSSNTVGVHAKHDSGPSLTPQELQAREITDNLKMELYDAYAGMHSIAERMCGDDGEELRRNDWSAMPEAKPPAQILYGPHVAIDGYARNWCDSWDPNRMESAQVKIARDTQQLPQHMIDVTNMALAQATAIPEGRVVGVYFDKQRRIWRATWREHGQGKRKTKNFSVDDYGFEEARRMAIQFRLIKLMEASDQAMHDSEVMQHTMLGLSEGYKSGSTPPSTSVRRKRRRYVGPDTMMQKIPVWAQTTGDELGLQHIETFSGAAVWPSLYGHPSAYVHMKQLQTTQQSWSDRNYMTEKATESRESTADSAADNLEQNHFAMSMKTEYILKE